MRLVALMFAPGLALALGILVPLVRDELRLHRFEGFHACDDCTGDLP